MKRMDLNLLRIFVSIFEERSLTLASDRLGLTQPALSHALRRLRSIVGDELFLRNARGMTPTIRAEELYDNVREHLSALEGSLEEEQVFNPALSTRSFTISMSDHGMTVLLPPLIDHLQTVAPNLKIQARYYAHGTQYEDLFSGRCVLSLTVAGDHPEWCTQEDLFTETAVGVCAISNKMIGPSPKLKDYLAAKHVSMAPGPDDRSWVDDCLEQLGQVRKVAHTVPHFNAIPAIIEGSHYISTLPRRIAERSMDQHRIRLFELPFAAPVHKIVQVWHRRKSQDAGHKWLRAQIMDQTEYI